MLAPPKNWSSSAVGNTLGEYVKSDLDSNVPSLNGRASVANMSSFKTNILSPKLVRPAKDLANGLPNQMRKIPPARLSGGLPNISGGMPLARASCGPPLASQMEHLNTKTRRNVGGNLSRRVILPPISLYN